mmetsp:Transcript_31846/g.67855  ORF Transcript_31846/g.67855 Transcript_31846/m.67855 type:complete len:214 (-) Transcript_31846:998-1639(-)
MLPEEWQRFLLAQRMAAEMSSGARCRRGWRRGWCDPPTEGGRRERGELHERTREVSRPSTGRLVCGGFAVAALFVRTCPLFEKKEPVAKSVAAPPWRPIHGGSLNGVSMAASPQQHSLRELVLFLKGLSQKLSLWLHQCWLVDGDSWMATRLQRLHYDIIDQLLSRPNSLGGGSAHPFLSLVLRHPPACCVIFRRTTRLKTREVATMQPRSVR